MDDIAGTTNSSANLQDGAKAVSNSGASEARALPTDEDAKDITTKSESGGPGKKDDTTKRTVSLRKLFGFADSVDRSLMLVGTLGAIVAGASQPLMTLLLGQLINAFGNNTSDTHRLVQEVSKVAVRFVYVGIGSAVSAYLEVACWMVAGERQAARIRSEYLKAILRQDISFFDTDTSTGEVVTRISGDYVLIYEALGEKVGKSIMLFSAFVCGFIVAFIKSWKLTLVLASTMPILTVAGGFVATFISKLSDRAQAAYAGAGTIVEQVVSSIRTVASFTGERKAVQSYDDNLKGAEKAGIWQGLMSGVGVGVVLGTLFLGYSLSLWYGSKLVLRGELNGGTVVNVIFAVLTGAIALGQASPSLGAIATGRAAAFNIFQVIERTPPIDAYDTSGLVPGKLKGDVELRHIHFHYPSRPDVSIFSDFSLLIPAGKTVALVGESGSGKSTVVSLIERFYDPTSGAVLVDGVDIRTLQLKWLRQQIGLVSQEPVLFGTSIRENIAYGKENATMEEIENAATLANAAKFITRIPQGYETLVGERGIQLSGGQKQRVAIARAILKNPRILLLDEATSALDAVSERVVQDALDRVMTDRTTVIVAHRLSTIRNANSIAVVQGGVIVETGVHDELVRKPDGAYSQLIRLQEISGRDDKQTESSIEDDPDYVREPEDSATVLTLASRDGLQDEPSSRTSGSFRTSLNLGLSHGDGSSRLSRERSSRLSGESSKSPHGDGSTAKPRSSRTWDHRADDLQGDDDLKKEGEKKAPRMKDVSILRLAKLNKPEAPLFVIGCAAAAVSGLIFPVMGLLIASVISSFYEPPHKLRRDVNFWALMFLLLAVVVSFAYPLQFFIFGIVGQKLIRRVRRITFEKVLRQEIGWFDEEANSSGAIGSRLSSDAAAVRSLVGDSLALVAQNIATVLGGMIIAFSSSWLLSFVVLAMVPLLGLHGYVQVKWLKGLSEDAKVKYEDATRVASDAVGGIRTVASFVAEEKVVQLYDERCKKPVKDGIRHGMVAGISLSFSNLVMFCSFALCFWVGGKLVDNGTTTFKLVFRVFFAITLSASSISQNAGLSPDFAKVKIAVTSIFSVIDRKSEIDPCDESGQILSDGCTGVIEFHKVCFFYPTRPDIQIFQDLSLKVEAGMTLAVVGESGSGKSTVISLIERFYDPQSGVISLDGVDIRKLQLRWFRRQIALVSQEPVLFDQSVEWNIVYGQEDRVVTEAEIRAAAEAANAHAFVSALPEGYGTRVGEKGIQLSGGQKQRVAIARAILKDPKILLLDEATSALDAEAEHAVQEALDRIMVHRRRTTIVVAHRLSTVRNADEIAVLKEGVIVERGKHADLIAKGGAYAALARLHLSAS